MSVRFLSLVVPTFLAVACGGSTSNGTSDGGSGGTPQSSGGTRTTGGAPATGGAMGSGGAASGGAGRGGLGGNLATGGVADAAATDGGIPRCGARGAVSNVRMSHAPAEPVPGGVAPDSGAPGDGGLLELPLDPCVTYATPDCPGPPRPIFGCPIVEGPNHAQLVHPGDTISVTLGVSDSGLGAYSCMGVDTESPLTGGSALFYAVTPAYVQETGQIQPSTPPGTVMHFTARASGTRYTSGGACARDLTLVDFDVTVE